jgi:hypothetical protein
MANSNSDVRLVVLPEDLYEYYLYVFKTHCEQGLNPEELTIAGELWKRIKASPKIDFSDLGKVKMENLSPTNVAISLSPDSPIVES